MPSQVVAVGRLLSGNDDAAPVDDAALAFDPDTGRIVAVGARRDLLAADAVPDVAFPDSTALPGLINGHVHLCFDPENLDPDELSRATPDDVLPAMYEAATTMLRQGVTTVRDTGDRLGAAARLRERHHPLHGSDPRPIPRLLVAGPPLTPPQGHCWFLGGAVDPDDDALRAAVDVLARSGVDWIKVMVSGGHITQGGAGSWESQFTRHQLDIIVAAAHAHDLPVAAHAHGVQAIADAADAGVATIEHCSMVTSSDLVPSYDLALAERIRASGAFVCQADNHDRDFLATVLNERAAEGWVGRARWLADHGVTLFCGTDAGALPFDSTVPALVAHAEDFSAADIVRMATLDAARALRIDHDTGRLEPGLSADVLVVDGDPSVDISALSRVRAVFARGVRAV